MPGKITGELRKTILRLLDGHRLASIATLRSDGWPQVTTVGYVSDGLSLWFLCAAASQKAKNIASDSRVSLSIDNDTSDPMATEGLSMAAHAFAISNGDEKKKVFALMAKKHPEFTNLPAPDPSFIRIFRLEPYVISVIDYSKGFGHTDLVAVTKGDLQAS